jgi:uncharacterized phiE125 gp8 family phage protein
VRDALGQPIHFGLTVTTDSTVEPISSTDAKLWSRIDGSASDTDITALILAARQKIEADTSLALTNKTLSLSLDSTPSGRHPIVLPVGPVSSVTSITSYSTADASSVVASSVYRLDTASAPARIVLKDGQVWPDGLRPETALVIVFVAGYGAAATSIPAPLIQAARLLIEHWFSNRGAVVTGTISTEVQLGYEALISPFRRRSVA